MVINRENLAEAFLSRARLRRKWGDIPQKIKTEQQTFKY
jgi:hypothetical protein